MVAYVRLPPPAAQHDAVEHYWMVEAPGPLSEVKREILIPNGRPGLAIALAEPGVRQDPVTGDRWANDAALFGLMTRPHVLTQTGMSSYGTRTTRRLARELGDLEFGQPRADKLAEFIGQWLQPVRQVSGRSSTASPP